MKIQKKNLGGWVGGGGVGGSVGGVGFGWGGHGGCERN